MVIQSTGLIHMVFNAGFVVQFVLLTLLVFSIASWSIIFIKYRYVQKAYKESIQFTEAFWKSRNLSDAFTKAKKLSRSPVALVFRTGFMELKKLSQSGVAMSSQAADGDRQSSLGKKFSATDNLQRALRRAINTEIMRLTQLVPFLATAGNTAPFIGLFGTVWGIMNSFQGIGQRGSASLAVVAPGISEALVATAAGLAVAIPSVIGFNYFTQKIRIIDAELQSFAADFLNIVGRDILTANEEEK